MSFGSVARLTRHLATRARPRALSLKARLAAARAGARAVVHGGKLAPGSLSNPAARALDDPHFLLKQAERHGPIFKARLGGKVTTCICGLALGRRFLSENEDKVRASTTDFTALFPHGTLRQMIGEPHREYRRAFVEAFKATEISAHEAPIRQVLQETLTGLAAAAQPVGREAIRSALKHGLTEILFRLILGIDRSWHGFDRLLEAYQRYAPNGTFIVVRPEHREIYPRMKELLLERAEELRLGPAFPSLLGYLAAAGKLDETAIGNLLQMTEAGRFDAMGLWCWLVRMLGENSGVLDQIADEKDHARRAALCEAVALEALRLEQSEFVLRRATSDIVFDGFFIPKRSVVRIAVWEAHKDPDTFEDPFRFDPKRFLNGKLSVDAYSPFGLDKHRCLGADWVIGLSAMFVERIALDFRCDIVADAAPAPGVFHFEPSRELSVRFRRQQPPRGLGSVACHEGLDRTVE